MALVPLIGESWYEELPCRNPEAWVLENVMPKLGKQPVTLKYMQDSLQFYLRQYAKVHIIADWPEDIERFCKLLIVGPGLRLDTPPLTMEVFRCCTISKNPHNALADAEALRDWYLML